jgi:protein O-mannosyl-transferase
MLLMMITSITRRKKKFILDDFKHFSIFFISIFSSSCYVCLLILRLFNTTTKTQCYKRILQLDPVNIQGLHNLCVVYVERGLLMKAHACLQEAHALAPNEDYIIKHLQIIESRLTRLKAQPGMNREKELAFLEFDPTEFGGRAGSKSSKSSLKMSQFSSSSSIKSKAENQQQSDEPQFYDTSLHDNYHNKHESLKQRIQNNFATDLDDPSSGMS